MRKNDTIQEENPEALAWDSGWRWGLLAGFCLGFIPMLFILTKTM